MFQWDKNVIEILEMVIRHNMPSERMVLFRIVANGWIGTHSILYRSKSRNAMIESIQTIVVNMSDDDSVH